MPELLRTVSRGAHCIAVASVGGGEGGGYLMCSLKPDHPGPLHYDDQDQIWWFADA